LSQISSKLDDGKTKRKEGEKKKRGKCIKGGCSANNEVVKKKRRGRSVCLNGQ